MSSKLFLLTLLIGCTLDASSQQWASEQIISIGFVPGRDLKGFDVDNDGDMDVVEINRSSVGWHENTDGLNNYLFHFVGFHSGGLNNSVNAGDIDGDGDLDIIAGAKEVIWYENNGLDFSVSHFVPGSESDGHFDVDAHDFDNDGDLDFVTHQLNVFLNDGQGNFTKIDIGGYVYEVEVVDFDFDGDLDILSIDGSELSLFRNNGGAVFSHEILISFGFDPDGWSFDVVDFDNDNDLDLIVGLDSSDEIFWFKNDGNGQFPDSVLIGGGVPFIQLRVFDADQDGDQDVIFSPGLRWNENLGNNTFVFGPPELLIPLPSAALFDIKDMDNDGDPDFLISQLVEQRNWVESTPNGLLSRNFSNSSTGPAGMPFTVWAEDFNGDGYKEAIYRYLFSANSKTAWQENLGNGLFATEQIENFDVQPGNGYVIRSGDINSDGIPDLVFGGGSGFGVGWYTNNHSGALTFQGVLDSRTARGLAIEDIDNDGDLDVCAALQFNDQVVWYQNDGNGAFGQPIVIGNPDEPVAVFVADMNGDHNKDLVVSTFDGYHFWYKNVGAGVFTDSIAVNEVTENWADIVSTAIGDCDMDGDIDILDNRNQLYLNADGQGNFASYVIIDSLAIIPPSNPQLVRPDFNKVLLVDIDKDYDPDLVAQSSQFFLVYVNNGSGGFEIPDTIQMLTTYGQIVDFYALDLDDDTDPDIICAFRGATRYSWIENLANVTPTIGISIQEATCNDNGTPSDYSDDFIVLKLSVPATALSTSCSIEVNDILIATGVTYGVTHEFELPLALDSSLILVITATDDLDPSFQNTTTISIPAPCPGTSFSGEIDSWGESIIYPNPTSRQTTLQLQLRRAAMIEVGLFNTLGKQEALLLPRQFAHAGYNAYHLDLNHFSDGVYWVKITVDNKTRYEKIVVYSP